MQKTNERHVQSVHTTGGDVPNALQVNIDFIKVEKVPINENKHVWCEVIASQTDVRKLAMMNYSNCY